MTAQHNGTGGNEGELHQDIISQFRVLNGYTHVLIGFQTAPTISSDEIVSALQSALDNLTDKIPWLGWQAAEKSGLMKPVPWPEDTPRKLLHVKDCKDSVSPMAQLLRKSVAFGMLDANILTPWPGIPVPHGIAGPLPIIALQANFIDGGVILSISAHHNIMDGTGIVQLARMLSTTLDGRDVPEAEIEQANRDRSRVVPLVPRGEPVKDHPHLRRPPGFEFRMPSSPPTWCYFNLPLTAQSRLVKTASTTGMVSENDIICAFYWQRLSVVRLAGGMHPGTVAKFTRAVDGRMALGIGQSYMGHMVCHAVTRLPVGVAASLPLGQLAQALRKDMQAANTPWAVRSYATILAREDRSNLMYAGAQNPEIDVGATSWVIASDRGKAHALGSWGNLLGEVRFCRPGRTAPLPGLFCPMPAESGAVPILLCLSRNDLEGLKKDAAWKQYMRFVG